jgi:uncharacterized protein (DUF302 family)
MTLRNVRRHLRGPAALLFALAAAVSTAALGSDDPSDKGHSGTGFSLTPFSRVAVIGPYSDPVDAYNDAKAAATAIATYVAAVDDTQLPTEFTSNWVLGGLEGDPTEDAIEEAILRVPTPYLIDPFDETKGKKKVNIVEMCNPLFAQKALGVRPVVDGNETTRIVNGYIHATALPCEVAIYADEDGYVNVEMLNPEAIFTLFFTDVLFGEQMDDPSFAEAIQELPAQVNYEIRTIIHLALDAGSFQYTPDETPLGPEYSSLEQVEQTVADTEYESPYVHFVYEKRGDRGDFDFSADDVSAVAAAIIDTLSLDGIHNRSLDAQLNIDDWRSARPAALPVPGNLVIEACSPTNAIAAMGLGMDHATALPCEIAIKALNWDGVAGNELLMVTYLNPHFMFSALFSDAFDKLTEDELDAFMELPSSVLGDLQTIVEQAVRANNLRPVGEQPIVLTRPEQVFFDMLPSADDD